MLESLVILVLILLSTSEGLINSIVSESFFISVPDPLHKSWMLINLLEEFSKMYLNCVKDMGILTFFTKIGSTDANCSFIESEFFFLIHYLLICPLVLVFCYWLLFCFFRLVSFPA